VFSQPSRNKPQLGIFYRDGCQSILSSSQRRRQPSGCFRSPNHDRRTEFFSTPRSTRTHREEAARSFTATEWDATAGFLDCSYERFECRP
jgi:hypothetical protein